MRINSKKGRKSAGFFLITAFAAGMIAVVLFAKYLAPYDPLEAHYDFILQPPSKEFWFGTDQLGRCILSRVLFGGRTSLLIAFLVTLLVAAIGIFVGTVSGFAGGILDSFIMRISDILMAFPGTVFVIALVSVLGPSLANTVIAMTVISWAHYARISRSQVLAIKSSDYIEQARMGGAGKGNILFRYVIPNILPSLLVVMTQDFGGKLLSLAGLSLLGLASQPPAPEWGYMLSEGKAFMQTAPWLLLFPGAAILINVIILNLLGDSLRDILDPNYH